MIVSAVRGVVTKKDRRKITHRRLQVRGGAKMVLDSRWWGAAHESEALANAGLLQTDHEGSGRALPRRRHAQALRGRLDAPVLAGVVGSPFNALAK